MQSPDSYGFFCQAKFSAGTRALEHIPIELDGYDARKPLVITNKKATKAGFGKQLVKAFCESNVIIGALYDDAPDYASIAVVRDLVQLYRDRGCDSIITIGGGAIVDIAKGVNIVVSTGNDDLLFFAGVDKIENPLKPLIVIPTAVSTGLETAGMAVIEHREIVSSYLQPDVITIDPRIVKPQKGDDIVATAAATLVYSIEGCITDPSNVINEGYAQAAIQFVFENLPKTLKCSRNKKRTIALANAAALAGIVAANAPVGYARAIGSAIADETGLHAGICMGVILPYALQYYQRKNSVMPELLFAVGGIDVFSRTADRERSDRAVALINELFGDLRDYIPATLKDLRVAEYVVKQAVAKAVAKGKKQLKQADCELIAASAFAGTPVVLPTTKK